MKEVKMDIGISESARREICKNLDHFFADSFSLYLKTHAFHWNVTGPQFQTLHLMFETQYQELWEALDEIAERIRALGSFAPGSYEQFLSLSSVKSNQGVPDAEQMIAELVEGHEAVCRRARAAIPFAEEAQDDATVDLLTIRLKVHEKTAWMLRSMLENPTAQEMPEVTKAAKPTMIKGKKKENGRQLRQ
jgi:starvation-inducible DNA-binding protein